MGVCDSVNKNVIRPQKKEYLKVSIYSQKSGSIQTIEKSKTIKTANESIILPLMSSEKLDKKIPLTESICKIEIKTKSDKNIITGFFLKFEIDQEFFFCLITNQHIISSDIINVNNIFHMSNNNEFKPVNIKLDLNKRYIKNFKEINLDITVIEILEEDNISKDYFLFPESEIVINNNLINREIYIPQYNNSKELKNARGKIKEINQYEFTYLVNTVEGASGSPVFLEKCINILGINKGNSGNKQENFADFIFPVINIIKTDIRIKRNNGKYINGKFIWDDGKYYVGEFKNNLPNGLGKKYYSNGYILYQGYFINGKFDGKGKYVYNNGNCFIGKYQNGLRIGKGIDYYKNGKIMFEGEYINGEKEGNGKYIWEDGQYYVGSWKNNLRHGKGIMHYANGKIKYEGDFFNDKPEGNGKYFWNNGEYFVGQYKNGLRNGKGKMYYQDGKIKYEGDFVDDKFEGNGKYIWEDGEYYEGQFKNNLSDGKGIMYYSDGKIQYEGDWKNDKYEGNGKYFWEDGAYYIGPQKNGLRNGKGIQYYPNGKIEYEGDYINDKFDGNGKYIWEDGQYYRGQWKNNLRHGKGILYDCNGRIQSKGNWINDIFVG